MLTKVTVVEQLEIKEDGTIQIRMEKRVMDGENIVSRQYHRTAVERDGDIDSLMDLVNTHLEAMGEERVSAGEITRIKAIAQKVWEI